MNINKGIYYINDVAKSEPNGGNKAKLDFIKVFDKMGFKEMDLSIKPQTSFFRNIIKVVLPLKLFFKCILLHKDNFLFVQIPTYSLRLYSPILFFLKNIIKFKMIIVIHDIERLRKIYRFSSAFLKNEDKYLEISDAIICHNKAMKNYLINRGISENKIFILGIFDYILDSKNEINKATVDKKNEINIAGNLDVRRSPYVYELLNSNIEGIKLKLYGSFYDEELVFSNKKSYKGCYPSDKIPSILTGGWGLVWDGESISSCTGSIGEYLIYINQHKASLYIAAGLPVIIWEKAGLAEFVKENRIGIVVSSLVTLKEQIERVSDEEYVEMVNHVLELREKLLIGGYAESVIYQVCMRFKG